MVAATATRLGPPTATTTVPEEATALPVQMADGICEISTGPNQAVVVVVVVHLVVVHNNTPAE